MAIFPASEIQRRQEAFSRALAARDVPIAFLNSADNVHYMTGVPLLSEWGRPMWAVLDSSGSARVIGAAIEKENMEQNARVEEALSYADNVNVLEASLNLVSDLIAGRKRPAKRIGIERAIMPLSACESLQARFTDTELVEIGDIIEDLRIIKSPEELALLEMGATVAKIGTNAFLEAIIENATELSVASHAVLRPLQILENWKCGTVSDTFKTAELVHHEINLRIIKSPEEVGMRCATDFPDAFVRI